MKCIWLLAFVLVASPFKAHSEHSALLPIPQKVQYGGAALAVSGLTIHFSTRTSEEDSFAGAELARQLAKITGKPVEIEKHGSHGRTVTLNRTGNGPALPADNEKVGPGTRESYKIEITGKGAEIRAPSSAGLFYGIQTLLQMVEGTGSNATLPEATIEDWPALPYRGMMMDFSEGELVRVSEVERQLDLLARYKANQYYFYTEASIEFEGYDVVNPNGRYTKDEVRHVIEYARKRHIDVVPCMELYGHMHNLFRFEKFADLGLPRYGGEFDPRNPKMYKVLDDWIEQTTRLFPSPWFHVGFDEPWSLGKIGLEGNKDPFKTFVDVLGHISGKLHERGRRMLFWADIMQGASTFSNHPELMKEIPKGAIACPWIYEVRTNYTPFVEPLAKLNIPTMITPGVWAWNELFPDYHRAFFNINGLTAVGRKFDTLGMINTTWCDSRQTIYRLQLPGMAFGAVAAWQPNPVNTNSFFKEFCRVEYPVDVAAEIAPALEDLSQAEEIFEKVLKDSTQSAFWLDPLAPGQLKKIVAGRDEIHRARLLAEDAQEHIQRGMRLSNDPTLFSTVVAARLFNYLGMKCLYAAEWDFYFKELQKDPKPELVTLYIGNQMNSTTYGMLTDLREMISELRGQYKEAWLSEATPFRLQSALYRWDAEWDYWSAVQRRVVDKVLHGWKKGEPFPAIDVIRPPR